MSIPPLVCSTPPPPDQCVDEKDLDDFGLQYNLSQDEEDNNYDYMGFSSCNHCQPQTPLKHNSGSIKNSTVESSVPHHKELDNVNGDTDFIQDDLASKTTAKEISSKAGTDFVQNDSSNINNTITLIQDHNTESKTEDNIVSSNVSTDLIQNVSPSTTIDANETINIEPDTSQSNNFEDEILELEDLNLELDKEIFAKNTEDQTNAVKSVNELSHDVNISNAFNENIPSVKDQENDYNVTLKITTPDIKDETEQIEDQINGPPTYIDELIENESTNLYSLNSDNSHTEPALPPEHVENIPDLEFKTDKCDTQLPNNNNTSLDAVLDVKINLEPANDDDDFGDFDDFQFAASSNTDPSTLNDCDSENPWSKKATDDFGDFKANLNQENSECNLLSKVLLNDKNTEHSNSSTENKIKTMEAVNDDDDFGDFDDFKSSSEKHMTDEIQQQYPVLNLQSTETETQIMESINKVLNSIFINEITEEEMEYQRLESHLAVTWNHLLEVDTRQPYIVNWNNSLGQKTLLKALCIDSRNILFGPKWGQNMPKYATNLTAAPLQPQKQTTSSSETTIPEKPVGRSTWSDPFTSDGQEFTYAEALLLDLEHLMATLDQMANHQSTLKISDLLSQAGTIGSSSDHPSIEIGPTDLDVFEAAGSSKTDTIYSSAPNVQPMRQINLPDTHIFTPTDSETPRSKTIHYESPILMPQTSIGVTEKVSQATDSNEDKDYWDFQDFKSKTSTQREVRVTTLNVSSSETTVGTQVLQPVKIEPKVPTLNWPDPGDIKETFEDFSDFVSNSTRSDRQETAADKSESSISFSEPISNLAQTKIKNFSKTELVSDERVPQTNIPETSIDTYEDDFDIFQSALPPKGDKFALDSKVMPQPQISTVSDSQLPFTNQKSDVISFPTYPGPSENPNVFLASNVSKLEPGKSSSVQSISLQPSLLQPIPASSTKNQNTSQILQPLSLESYSQINWPNPGIDLQDLSRFNPVETLNSLKTDLSTNSNSKNSSPVHINKVVTHPDDDWGDFVSSKPKLSQPKKSTFADDDDWSDFVSSPSVKPQNGLNTISLNVSTNVNVQKNKFANKSPQMPYDIPTLNYITPKTNSHQSTTDRHFQNL